MLIASLSSISGNAVRGRELSDYCIGCRGEYGVTTRLLTPNLAEQNKGYLKYALKTYRNVTCQGGLAVIMQANASALSAQDISDLATYLLNLPGKIQQSLFKNRINI